MLLRIITVHLMSKNASAYLILVSAPLVLLFMLPQQVSEYVELFVDPESVFGNSRILLALGPLLLMMYGFFSNRVCSTATHRQTCK